MSSGKVIITLLMLVKIKQIWLYKKRFYQNQRLIVEDWNFAKKIGSKKSDMCLVPDFAKNVDLTNLKLDLEKLNIDKLKTVSIDLRKVNVIVENVLLKSRG